MKTNKPIATIAGYYIVRRTKTRVEYYEPCIECQNDDQTYTGPCKFTGPATITVAMIRRLADGKLKAFEDHEVQYLGKTIKIGCTTIRRSTINRLLAKLV